MVFKIIRQRSLGALAHAEYKVMTGNGTDVYMFSNDLIKPDNYVMSTLTRQYVALAEYTTRDDKPAWKIWNGNDDLGFLDIGKRGPYTFDLNGAGLHVNTSATNFGFGVTAFTNNEGKTVAKLLFARNMLMKQWVLELDDEKLAIPCLVMAFMLIKAIPVQA